MADSARAHLTDEQLARCQDGEAPAPEAAHLHSCAACAARLRDVQAATTAYEEYRDSVRGPMFPPPPQPWARLDALIAQHEAAQAPRAFRWWIPAMATAACAIAVVAVLYQSEQPSRRATELLAESARVAPVPGQRISLRLGGRAFTRPAVLLSEASTNDAGLEHLHSLFDTAHYSWQEPLSARSFQTWRSRAAHKRDSVTVIQESGRRSYRVRTETPDGTLRSAALTLRAEDLQPSGASFDFAGEGTLDVAEATVPREPAAQQPGTAAPPPAAETFATPEDTLHVLAALNRLGADVGEPVAVSEDTQHRRVVVHLNGLAAARQREIEEALRPLPRVTVDLDSAAPGTPASQPAEHYSSSLPPALRTRLEERLGGAVALQEATDRVLDDSGLILARAHAVRVLAEKFPRATEARLNASDRELLLSLRQRHAGELQRLVARIRTSLKPLLASAPADHGTEASWQAAAATLTTAAQETDQLLNRLLAGNYSQPEGEEMLRTLSPQMDRLDAAVQALHR